MRETTVRQSSRNTGLSELQIYALMINRKVRYKKYPREVRVINDSISKWVDDHHDLYEVLKKQKKQEDSSFSEYLDADPKRKTLSRF